MDSAEYLGFGCQRLPLSIMALSESIDANLDNSDVRSIVRLLGEIIAMRGDINDCRRALMDGLCPLVGADAWLWCMAEIEPGKALSHSGILHGGFDDERFTWFLKAINHPSLAKANHRAAEQLATEGRHITLGRRRIEDPSAPILSGESGDLWHKAGVGTLMLSLRPMEHGGATGVGLYRNPGGADFNEREIRIAHIVLTEVSWLHYENFPEKHSLSRLSPRHRTVLNLLCEGWPRKKIAAHLKISENTVHGYAKELFRHFDVHSQAELITRLTKGTGGDLP